VGYGRNNSAILIMGSLRVLTAAYRPLHDR
jgi:hypothetical protein